MIERAVLEASGQGARVIVGPELLLSGYGFRDVVGTDWIAWDQAAVFAWAGELARRADAVLVLGLPEASATGSELFNSLIVFGSDGRRLGHHRKVNVLKVGSESWSSPGAGGTAVTLDGLGRVGLFICADMYSQRLVQETASQGVDLLLSAAAWAPGLHGPNGEWEWASQATGRPVIVCNRTGVDVLDFSGARSVVAVGGSIAVAHAAPGPAIILVDWQATSRQITNWRVFPPQDRG